MILLSRRSELGFYGAQIGLRYEIKDGLHLKLGFSAPQIRG